MSSAGVVWEYHRRDVGDSLLVGILDRLALERWEPIHFAWRRNRARQADPGDGEWTVIFRREQRGQADENQG